MRLLLVTQDFPPVLGGIQTYCKALADRFHLASERFAVLAPYARGSRGYDRSLPYPVHRVPVPSSWLRHVLTPSLMHACTGGGYRSLFLAQWHSVPAAAKLKKRRWVDYLYCAAHGQELVPRGASDHALTGRFARRRAALDGVDAFFPVSHFTAELLLKQARGAGSRVHVVHNGTDPERFTLPPQRALELALFRQRHGLGTGPLLLTTARLVRRKGIDTVLRALPRVSETAPEVRYAVIGEGPERRALEALSSELGVRERVHFLGALPDEELLLAYHACDIFVMPARNEGPSVEGFGLVFLEAGACGKPVVGARAGGVPDAIVHAETGLLVEPADAEGLALALTELISDPKLAQRLGEQGRRRVLERGTWDHTFRSMLEVMQRSEQARPAAEGR